MDGERKAHQLLSPDSKACSDQLLGCTEGWGYHSHGERDNKSFSESTFRNALEVTLRAPSPLISLHSL